MNFGTCLADGLPRGVVEVHFAARELAANAGDLPFGIIDAVGPAGTAFSRVDRDCQQQDDNREGGTK
jgi:hypothetical protein